LSATLPEPLFAMGCIAVGAKIYLFGGNTSNKIYCFNTADETIITLEAKLPQAMSQMAYAGVGTKIYLFGGWGGGAHNTILVFDTVTEQIETLSSTLPKSLFMACAATVGDNIYIFGGQATAIGSGNQNTDVYVFNTVSQKVRKASIDIEFTVGSACFTYGDKIYIAGGCQYWTSSSPYANGGNISVKEVTTATDFPLAENDMFIRIPTTATDNIFYLVNTENVKIENGIQTVYKGNADGIGEPVEAALYKNGAWTNI
jgi:N-acetylneuraminic acid mutarotase